MTMLAGMPLTFWLLVIVILFALGALLGFLLALEMWEPLVPFVEKTFLRFWARTKDCFARLLGFLLALQMWEPLVPFVEKTFLRFWARTKDCFARFARK
jgi:hypothetical protein